MRALLAMMLALGCAGECYLNADCRLGDGGWPPCGWLWQRADGGWAPTEPICREGECIQECAP